MIKLMFTLHNHYWLVKTSTILVSIVCPALPSFLSVIVVGPTSLLGEPGSPSFVVLCVCACDRTRSKICIKEVLCVSEVLPIFVITVNYQPVVF